MLEGSTLKRFSLTLFNIKMVFPLEEALWKASLRKAFGFLNFLRSGKVRVCTFLGNRHQDYLGLQAPLWKSIRLHSLNPFLCCARK